MKVFLARDYDGLCAFSDRPKKYEGINPFDEDDFVWQCQTHSSLYAELNPNLFPEVTIENSPIEMDLDIELCHQ